MLKYIKHHLLGIEGIEIFPLISLLIFSIFFVFMLILLFKNDKEYLKEVSKYPINEE